MFNIEDAIKLVEKIGRRPAARHYGIDPATLASRIKAYRNRQAQSEAVPQSTPNLDSELESEAEPEPHRFAMIRRHENETRKREGLPPFTNEEWATEKAKLEECERQMQHLQRSSND